MEQELQTMEQGLKELYSQITELQNKVFILLQKVDEAKRTAKKITND